MKINYSIKHKLTSRVVKSMILISMKNLQNVATIALYSQFLIVSTVQNNIHVVDNLIQKNLVNKYKENEMNSLELSLKSRRLENPLIATTLHQNNHSTAVMTGHHGRSSIQKGNEACKFYSLSNSMAKIKLENRATLNGTFAQINNMPNIMRSILQK